MSFQQLLIALSLQGKQGILILLSRITTNVVVVDIVGGSNDIQHSCRSMGDTGSTATAIGLYLHTTLSSKTAFDSLVLRILYRSRQDTIASFNFVFQRTSKVDIKRQGPLLAGSQSYDDGMICQRGEDGTLILHTVINIRGGIHSITDIQFTAIVRNLLMT